MIWDERIQLRGTASRKKYKDPLRRVTFVDPESQKRLVFLTNDFDRPAETIAAIYKARWEIELFFKAIQQALKIKTFLGTSQNAVLTQVWIALIAYLLLSYFRFRAKSVLSVLCLIRRLGRALFQRRDLTAWLLHQEPDPLHPQRHPTSNWPWDFNRTTYCCRLNLEPGVGETAVKRAEGSSESMKILSHSRFLHQPREAPRPKKEGGLFRVRPLRFAFARGF